MSSHRLDLEKVVQSYDSFFNRMSGTSHATGGVVLFYISSAIVCVMDLSTEAVFEATPGQH